MNRRDAVLLQAIEGINRRFDSVDQRFDSVDQRFDGIYARFDTINDRLDRTNARIDTVIDAIAELRTDLRLHTNSHFHDDDD